MLKRCVIKIMNALINERDRMRHTYITGGSGSGKSELIKILVHAYLQRKDYCTTIVLDPHGDLSQEIAEWKECYSVGGESPLVYIDPFLKEGYTPVINPFQIENKSDLAIDLAAQELTGVFKELLKGTPVTLQMETLLIPCVSTILRIGGTLEDLQTLMNDERNQKLLKIAQQSPNPAHRRFFQEAFLRDNYTVTKNSIYTKIQSLLNSTVFYNLIVGKSTINLYELINSKKLIVFNLAKGQLGSDASDAFGRFIIATIQSLALQRAGTRKQDRVPIHLFIDEVHNYISPSIERILTEARKYGLFLTMANQIMGQMETKIKRIILGNTAVKLTGKNSYDTLNTMAKESGVKLEDLQRLTTGEFILSAESREPMKVKVPSHLIASRNAMTAAQWQKTTQSQIQRFYRPISSPGYADPSDEGENASENHTDRKGDQSASDSTPKPRYPLPD